MQPIRELIDQFNLSNSHPKNLIWISSMPYDELMRRLWIRVGICACVGFLIFGLILITVGGWGIALLLLLGVWAFCRAAYWIVQLSEHSTNRQSFSTHLLSFFRRIVIGKELDANCQLNTYGCDLEHAVGTPARAVNQLLLKLFCWAVVSCLFAPPLFDNFLGPAFRGTWERYLAAAWMSWLVACTAMCILFGALLDQPFKHRVPLSCAALFALVMALMIGIKITDKNFSNSDSWVIFIFATATFVLGFTVLWLYRWKWSWTIGMSAQSHSKDNDAGSTAQNQVSVRYMIAAMTGVAFSIALVKFLFPAGFNLPQGAEFFPRMFLVMLVGATILMALSSVSISLLHVILPSPSKRTNWHVAWIAVLAGILPYALMVGMTWLEQSPRVPSQVEFVSMYIFFLSYIAILSVLLLTLANAGLCLRRAPVCTEAESVS